MVSDAIDYQELQTGKRNEGSVYATYSMICKIGQGVGQALLPAMIAFLIQGLDLSNATTWLPEYPNSVKNHVRAIPGSWLVLDVRNV